MRFHRKCGDRVTLLNDNTTAVRNFVEFNHGLILSSNPLKDDELFEVRIDKKVTVWNGSLEIGVTTLDPDYLELPATATKLRDTAWIMSGNSIVKNGVAVKSNYGPELDALQEGDILGVMRTNNGELMFFINGHCLGVAADDLPSKVFAVIDLYGQCVQVSIVTAACAKPEMESHLEQVVHEDPFGEGSGPIVYKNALEVYVPMPMETACGMSPQDALRFHPRCGILIVLTGNNKTAERARPLDDYNNGVVMTHRPLYDNELFQVRIETLVDKWSGSIEIGVTSLNPGSLRFPATMTNMESGTVMMSGSKIIVNSRGTFMEYGNVNLDDLREGDIVGVARASNGNVNFFINGVDQGVAIFNEEPLLWGVVDLYGMTVKVTIIDQLEQFASYVSDDDPELNVASNHGIVTTFCRTNVDEDSLFFHTLRDSNVIIINNGKTAHRPNALEFFKNGIVMTNRPLRTNELFQVRLDLVIPKWAGSIEIGVTQHSFTDVKFTFKMSSDKFITGTWAMTGEDVIRDGMVIVPQYVKNLNKLVEGDTVGVMRKDMGILHFFVNGADKGPAAFNVPENVYGIVDLYGRVGQITIVDVLMPSGPLSLSPDSPISTGSNATVYPEMCFHRIHGRNAQLSKTRLTATRTTIFSEFNDAVLFSSRPLRECEMFEIRITKTVDCWVGNIEMGVTAICPDELEESGSLGVVAGTATDLCWDTYILSGSAIMKNGECVRNDFRLDLDLLTAGNRIGMMRHSDRSLHFYLDGIDQGKALYVPHLNIYAVVDLYGQCTQVTIIQNEERLYNYNGCATSYNSLMNNARCHFTPPSPYCINTASQREFHHSFSEYCGDNLEIVCDYTIAQRMDLNNTSQSLCFSSGHLIEEEIFEIKIMGTNSETAGSLKIGITDINILNAHINRRLPNSINLLPHFCSYLDGKYLKYTVANSAEHGMKCIIPSLEWLRRDDRIGMRKTRDRKINIYYNNEQLNVGFENVPDKVFVVVELNGTISKVKAVSKLLRPVNSSADQASTECVIVPKELLSPLNPDYIDNATATLSDIEEVEANGEEPPKTEVPQRPVHLPYTFYDLHGSNVKLVSSDTVAIRAPGAFNNSVVIVSHPLVRGRNFIFRVDKMEVEWAGSAAIGCVSELPTEPLPSCAICLSAPAWIIASDIHFDNGTYLRSDMAKALENIEEQATLSVYFLENSNIVLVINSQVAGVIGRVPDSIPHVYPVIDLYGRVAQVSALLYPHTVTPLFTMANMPQAEPLEFAEQVDQEEEMEPLKARANSEVNITNADIVEYPITSHELESDYPVYYDYNNIVKILPSKCALHHSLMQHRYIDFTGPKSCSTESFYGDRILKTSASLRVKVENLARDFEGMTLCPEETQESPDEEEVRPEDIQLPEAFQLPPEDIQVSPEGIQVCRMVPRGEQNFKNNDNFPEPIADNIDTDSTGNDIDDEVNSDSAYVPDLNEDESSSSISGSINNDDLAHITYEHMRYLNHMLSIPEDEEEPAAGAELAFLGEGCQHLHLVLRYWDYLVSPFVRWKQVLSCWGQVKCFCSICCPQSGPLAGWVRIERVNQPPSTTYQSVRRYWCVDRTIITAAHSSDLDGPINHPLFNATLPNPASPPLFDLWYDDVDRPLHTVIVLEIDVSLQPEEDVLTAFIVYIKPFTENSEEE